METVWTAQRRCDYPDTLTLVTRKNATVSFYVDNWCGSRKPLWRKSPWVQIPPPPPGSSLRRWETLRAFKSVRGVSFWSGGALDQDLGSERRVGLPAVGSAPDADPSRDISRPRTSDTASDFVSVPCGEGTNLARQLRIEVGHVDRPGTREHFAVRVVRDRSQDVSDSIATLGMPDLRKDFEYVRGPDVLDAESAIAVRLAVSLDPLIPSHPVGSTPIDLTAERERLGAKRSSEVASRGPPGWGAMQHEFRGPLQGSLRIDTTKEPNARERADDVERVANEVDHQRVTRKMTKVRHGHPRGIAVPCAEVARRRQPSRCEDRFVSAWAPQLREDLGSESCSRSSRADNNESHRN